jgi:type IV secretory pathway VirD2 relaxase
MLLLPQRAFSPPAGWKNRFNSFAFAAKPQKQTKKTITSLMQAFFMLLLPQRAFSPPAGWKNRFNSFAFAALPQKQTKKTITSLLPQAGKAIAA